MVVVVISEMVVMGMVMAMAMVMVICQWSWGWWDNADNIWSEMVWMSLIVILLIKCHSILLLSELPNKSSGLQKNGCTSTWDSPDAEIPKLYQWINIFWWRRRRGVWKQRTWGAGTRNTRYVLVSFTGSPHPIMEKSAGKMSRNGKKCIEIGSRCTCPIPPP